MSSLKAWQADALLLLTSMIWGFAFVAQRSGMAVIGPLAYSGVRFALGTLILIPVWFLVRRQAIKSGQTRLSRSLSPGQRWLNILLAGVILFVGSNLQQMGMVYTTASNAGFITCFYVVLVPIVGIFIGHPATWRVWTGALLALGGLYVLSVGGEFSISVGDMLVLIGAFVWTAHILVINRLASRMDALEIALGQFAVCAVLSLASAMVFEPRPFEGVAAAAIPILYGGIFSIGIAFTLQVIAQKRAHPARASIIMSMEALFAGIGGVLILGEALTLRLVIGGLAMLAGMILAQLEPSKPAPAKEPAL